MLGLVPLALQREDQNNEGTHFCLQEVIFCDEDQRLGKLMLTDLARGSDLARG